MTRTFDLLFDDLMRPFRVPTVVAVRRDFADAPPEAWSARVASQWEAYVRDMLRIPGFGRLGPMPVAVHLRLSNGQAVTFRRRGGK